MFSAVWRDPAGQTRSARVRGIDVSRSGIRIECPEEIPLATEVFLQAEKYQVMGNAFVRHCSRRGASYSIGLEFSAEMKNSITLPAEDAIDYYEVLQISPNAEVETIHRVYRIMAARFHPDNPETRDPERFLLLKRAYQTLIDPEQRARYDTLRQCRASEPYAIFELKDFVDGVSGEMNRRLGVLALLYNQMRASENETGLSLLDLERRMLLPREYLHFTLWYLKSKGYVAFGQNSDYLLTATGADYVESNSGQNEIVSKLLNGPTSWHEPFAHTPGADVPRLAPAARSAATA